VESLEESRERVHLAADGDCRVRGDEAWLGRAARNLIDNAIVHSAPGTPVRVVVSGDGASVVVRVENEGAVPSHVQPRAFRRFVTTRPEKGGTGLGLSIVRAVAEAHGGRAELLGAGPPMVEFRLTLPAFRLLASHPDPQ
jgi:signal transduction histidine kinase